MLPLPSITLRARYWTARTTPIDQSLLKLLKPPNPELVSYVYSASAVPSEETICRL